MSNFYVTSTTSAQQEVSAQVTNEAFWRIKYYAVLDSVIENLIRRFSDQSLELAQSVDNFFLLDFKESKLFINHYKVRIHHLSIKSLNNEYYDYML